MYLIYYKIFISTLKLAFLSFGGGVATISLIKDEFVIKNKFVTTQDFDKIVVLANAMPGATMTQIISYISHSVGGFMGFLIAFITLLFPASLLLSVLLLFAHSYFDVSYIKSVSKGVLPAVLAIMAVFAIDMLKKDLTKHQTYNYYLYFSIFILSLFLLILKINVAIIFMGMIFLLITLYRLRIIKKWMY